MEGLAGLLNVPKTSAEAEDQEEQAQREKLPCTGLSHRAGVRVIFERKDNEH
jgi:hypothetical protein